MGLGSLAKPNSCAYEASSKGGKKMSEELAYSIHLGSDKNKTTKAKEIAKSNSSGETSFSNNGIQNATQLSKVNKHNLRDYDNVKDEIYIIYGTDNLYKDVQNLYLHEFEQARLEYNEKQTREDRKIDNYFKHISQDKQKDLACEFIIELGDMDFWNDKDINEILDNLKPTKLNKNNMIISNENIQKIKNYTKGVKDITQTVKSVNDLNMAISEFEHSAFEIEKENRSLKYQLELKDDEISNLKSELSTKDKIIGKLQTEKEKLKQELQKFKGFWHSIMNHFHRRICYDKDNNYKIVSEDLYKNGIFDNNDNEITTNICRRVTIPDENKNEKNRKKNDTRF